MFELNDLLRKVGVDPTKVIVMRHQPTDQNLRTALRWFAAENIELYNAYQCCQGEKAESALARASHLVSFLGHAPGKALLVGLYKVEGYRKMTGQHWWTMATSKQLLKHGDRGPRNGPIRLFNLIRTNDLTAWKGKLVVDWPPLERTWYRWAAKQKNRMLIHAIHEESILIPPIPDWRDLVLPWQQLQALPKSWQIQLAQWRGVYLILDCASGKSYVGSASGKDNLLARWLTYAKTCHGGNVELRGRDPAKFRFSILQVVQPDCPDEEMLELEETWKKRLHTREFGLNKN